jgi:N-acetylmuramoyl-L-alanine amidase
MFKKFGIIFLCSFIFLGAFHVQPRTLAANDSATITSNLVNIREGPGLSYSVVKKVDKDETYPILKEEGDWIQIELSNGKKGWIANWLVSKNQGTSSTSGQTATSAEVIENDLRVRKGPGTSFQIIGYLNKGEKVDVIEDNENWFKISTTFGKGWVSKQFLNLKEKQSKKQNSNKQDSQNLGEGIIQTNSLNVREKPSLTGKVLGKLQKGTKVMVFSQKEDWTEISFSNQRAWISTQFIELKAKYQDSTDAEQAPKGGGLSGTITATTLNLRSSASLNGSVIGTVKKGQRFKIVEEMNNWAKLEIKANNYGWVAGWYLDKSSSEITAPKGQAVNDSTISILHNGTNIRKSSSLESDVMYRANEGETFTVKSLHNNWYEILLPNGSSGYVAGWIVTVSGSAPQVEKAGAEKHLKNKTIILDPGHGGEDNGTTGARGTIEKELTLRTANLLYDKLKASGANVILTHSKDSYLSLRSRVSTSHYHNADAFISIHYDSITDKSVRGMTTYYYDSSYQKPLAEAIHSPIISQTKLKDRGYRFGDFHVLRENKRAAVLLELGYLSNPAEEVTVNSNQYQEAASSGMFNGLARYFKKN